MILPTTYAPLLRKNRLVSTWIWKLVRSRIVAGQLRMAATHAAGVARQVGKFALQLETVLERWPGVVSPASRVLG